jgi:o-succinylbenzoate---CoA ligase
MDRPVKAVVLPPGPRLLQLLSDALDGTPEGGGPAICPLSPDLPRTALAGLLDALRPTVVETADGERRYDGDAPFAPVAGDTAVLIATSGSTGHPKIAQLSGAALRHSATATLSRVGAAPGDRWLCCLPTSHIAGLQVLVRSLVAGTAPVIHPYFDVAAVAAGAAAHLSLVPTQLRRLVDADADLSAFRTILLGGAPAGEDLLAAARARGGRVITTYGMSETCGGCVYDGVPLDGVSVAIGADDRIRLAGPVLFSGYRKRPAATGTTGTTGTIDDAGIGAGGDAGWDGEWFVTQDLGVLEDGRLRVRGRADDVINTGGEKVIAGEVAGALNRHPAVADVVVVGRRDAEWGERVTAVVVPTGQAPTLEELRAWVRGSMPRHAAPRELELVEAIPLLPSGKPDRERLRRR